MHTAITKNITNNSGSVSGSALKKAGPQVYSTFSEEMCLYNFRLCVQTEMIAVPHPSLSGAEGNYSSVV